jgi:transcriptional regulator with XRE-family HTH domain
MSRQVARLTATQVPEFDVADRMRKALRTSGVGAQEMAEYLGVCRNSVSNWINGHHPADRRTLLLWALRTGVPFEWLDRGVC